MGSQISWAEVHLSLGSQLLVSSEFGPLRGTEVFVARESVKAAGISVGAVTSRGESVKPSNDPEEPGTAMSTGNTWNPEKTVRVRLVGSVDVSPDGRKVVFASDEAVMEAERSEYSSQIYLANTDGSDCFPLTFGEKADTNPRWSPDGQWIGFISTGSGKANIWVMRVRGGCARMMTDMKTEVIGFKWSPDGNSIAFLALDPQTPEREKAVREKNDAWVVTDNTTLTRVWTACRLWIIPFDPEVRKSVARCLTPNHSVANAVTFQYIAGFERPFDWSPDGKTIAFVHVPSGRGNDWTKASISLVDIFTLKVRPLCNTGASEQTPLYSPDGRWLAYVSTDDPPTWGFNKTVRIISANGGVARELAATHDRQPELVSWSSDSKSIFIIETRGTVTSLYSLPMDGPPAEVNRRVGVITSVSLNRSGTMFGFCHQTLENPPEAHVSPVSPFEPVQVSSVNAASNGTPPGNTRLVQWNSVDGLDIEGLLTLPAGYNKDQRYPLILAIHGGPMAVFTQEFTGSRNLIYPVAALASRGYAVLRCNIRGSSGYGKDFRYLNFGDWGGRDYQDLMAGVDHVVKLGVADPERMGVLGWSYGGYMTSWIITQTARFRAAVIGVPVTNLISFSWTTEVPDFIPNFFGGEPWDKPEVYLSHSPVVHMKGASTPALILHGELDDRVPISQAYELYNALRRAGCMAEMVVYPRSHHVPAEPKLLLDTMSRTVEWFEKYVKFD